MARPNLFVRSSKRLLILGVLFLIGFGFWDNLRGAIYVLIPPQVEAFLYRGLHYLAQGVNLISPQQVQGVFLRDWLVGGLLIGWLIPTLSFILVCITGYFTTIRQPHRTKGKPPLDFSLLQDRVSKSYWRAKLMDLERTSFAVLAVGGALFLTLLATKEYFIERFPFAGGATLLCFIGYSYIFNLHFLFFRTNSPRKVIGLIDSRLQLRQGLLTLWDNRQFKQSSPLGLVLARRVQEKLKRFKPGLIFPHRSPNLNRYNFLFPLLIISCLSISSALALPRLRNSLQKYLHSGIITGNKIIISSPAKRSTLDDNLLQQGKELKQLSQQLAGLNNPNITPTAAISLRRLGNDLISLSKQNKAGAIMAGKKGRLRAEALKRNKGKTPLGEAEKEILQTLLEKQIAAAKYRLTSNPIPLSNPLKHSLPAGKFSPLIDKKSQLPLKPLESSHKLKGKISAQLRGLAKEMLALNLARREDTTGRRLPTTVKTRSSKPGGNKSAKGKGGKIKAFSRGQDYQKARAVLAKLNKSGDNRSQTQVSMNIGGPGAKSKDQARKGKQIAVQKGRQNKAATARGISPPDDNTPPMQTTDLTATDEFDSLTIEEPDNELLASKPGDEKQKSQQTKEIKETTDTNLASNKMDSLDSKLEDNNLEAERTADRIPRSYLRVVPLINPPEVNYETNAPTPSVFEQINSLGNRIKQIGERRDTTIVSSESRLKDKTKLQSTSPKTAGKTVSALENVITQQRQGLEQITNAIDTASTPEELSDVSNQLASIAKWMNKKTSQLAQAIKPYTKIEPKDIPSEQQTTDTNPTDNSEQRTEMIPSGKHRHPGIDPREPNTRFILPEKMYKLKQAKMMNAVVKSKGNLEVGEIPTELTRGPAGLSEIAAQFAKLGTKVLGTTQPDKLKQISQEMLALSSKLSPGGSEQIISGGTGSRGQKAVVVSGQNSRNKTNDMARVRLQSFPTHDPSHDSLVNLSKEVGLSSQTMKGTPQRLSFQRQAKMSGTSMTNIKDIKGGLPALENVITQRRQGLEQLKKALDTTTTPEERSNISRQLANVAQELEKDSLQLEQVLQSEAESESKGISSKQQGTDSMSADKSGQRLEPIPSGKHEHPGAIDKQPAATFILSNKMDELKQVRREDRVIKGKGNLQVNKIPSQLTTGSAGLSEIARQFARLRTEVSGTTQAKRLQEISQEMLELSSKLSPGGLEQMFLAGAEARPGKKTTGKHILKGNRNLKPAAKPSSSKFLYPEVGSIKGGKSLAQLKKRETLALPQEFKKKLDQLKNLNKKLGQSKQPEQIQEAAKEILQFSQHLYGLTPKREEKTLAILKEGVKRQGEKVKQLSKKLSRTKNPQKIAGYALELSRYAANLKTLGDKSEALGWKEGKGLRKYARKLEQTAKLLTKSKQDKQKTDSPASSKYQEKALRRNAQRIKELSQIIVASKEVEKVQKAAEELLKLSQELNDMHYNLGLGKTRASFAPQARNTAQEAVRQGGAKLQQLVQRIKEQQGDMQLDDIGLQLKSVASNLNRIGKKKLPKGESTRLKKVSEGLSQIAAQLKRQGASSASKRQSSGKRTAGKGKTGAVKGTPLNRILPRLAQYADELKNMGLGNKGGGGNRETGDSPPRIGRPANENTLKQLETGLQETVSPGRLLQIASQIEGLGKELLKAPLERDAPTPSQRPSWQQGKADFPDQTKTAQFTPEVSLLEMKKQAAVQKLDDFLNELSEQQQKMGAYSMRNVSANTSGERGISAVSKGVGGGARQSLFSKGQKTKNPTAQGSSKVPLSKDVDNFYPMEEDLASDRAFASIITRVKRYRDKLASSPFKTPKSSLSRLTSKGEKQKTSPRQAKLPANLRWDTKAAGEEQSTRRSNIGPQGKTLRRKTPAASSAPQPAKVVQSSHTSSFELPVLVENAEQLRVPFKTRRPRTKIEARQKLAARQDAAGAVTRSRIPPEYQNIFKKIYLYFQDFSSQSEQPRQ